MQSKHPPSRRLTSTARCPEPPPSTGHTPHLATLGACTKAKPSPRSGVRTCSHTLALPTAAWGAARKSKSVCLTPPSQGLAPDLPGQWDAGLAHCALHEHPFPQGFPARQPHGPSSRGHCTRCLLCLGHSASVFPTLTLPPLLGTCSPTASTLLTYHPSHHLELRPTSMTRVRLSPLSPRPGLRK